MFFDKKKAYLGEGRGVVKKRMLNKESGIEVDLYYR